MSFYDTIYNAMYAYTMEIDIDIEDKNWIEIAIELGEKYMDIVEGPLTDAISDAVFERVNEG